MGGRDWQNWLEALKAADVLSDDCISYNYSYLGSKLNAAIYREGSLGAAKEHMYQTARTLRSQGFHATVVVCKALVTKASLFIPLMAPYVMALKAELKKRHQEENVFDQMARLFSGGAEQDDDLLRLDNFELAEDVQAGIEARIKNMTTEDFSSVDYEGVKRELLAMHGFTETD
jgi:enoyl-[acyl-carrier protein] reductase/trans-2-enoyl-CoA reductase (NAD+)